ncbi:MAG: hypothetical protein G8237_09790 [Magnetococcales bacterium]|nr:hypothetical protein [Magnetococcales bacterium]NGZ06635.1 hypothetical protein [Magnetococcales bacterium]
MKYVVELFDGRRVRGLLMDQQRKTELLARLEQLDPALGVVVLDITPESLWRGGRRADGVRRRASAPNVDRVRTLPLERIMA